MTEQLKTAVRRVYRKSPQFALDQLLRKRIYWQRKQTIASNKLSAVQRQIEALAQENVNALMGKETK